MNIKKEIIYLIFMSLLFSLCGYSSNSASNINIPTDKLNTLGYLIYFSAKSEKLKNTGQTIFTLRLLFLSI